MPKNQTEESFTVCPKRCEPGPPLLQVASMVMGFSENIDQQGPEGEQIVFYRGC
jgi:hypothetical protein